MLPHMGPEDADIGADVDAAQIMSEVREEVARKRAEGLYPREVVLEIDSARNDAGHLPEAGLDAALAELRLSAQFSSEVGTESSKRFVAPAVERVKSLIQSTVKWYVGAVLDQIRLFSENSIHTVSIMARRLQELESRLEELEKEVREPQAKAD